MYYGVAVEYDGAHHRTERHQYIKDIRRLEMLERMGWIIVGVVAEHQPAEILRRVRAAIADRVCAWGFECVLRVASGQFFRPVYTLDGKAMCGRAISTVNDISRIECAPRALSVDPGRRRGDLSALITHSMEKAMSGKAMPR